MAHDQPLKVSVEGDELVIRIGVSQLAQAAERCEYFYRFESDRGPPYIEVTDKALLAQCVVTQLLNETPDGGNPVISLLNIAICTAWESNPAPGSDAWGVDLDDKSQAKSVNRPPTVVAVRNPNGWVVRRIIDGTASYLNQLVGDWAANGTCWTQKEAAETALLVSQHGDFEHFRSKCVAEGSD